MTTEGLVTNQVLEMRLEGQTPPGRTRGEGVACKVLTNVQEFPGLTSSELFEPGSWQWSQTLPRQPQAAGSRASPGGSWRFWLEAVSGLGK